MAKEKRSWARQSEAFWRAHHEAAQRLESTTVLRGARHPAQGVGQLAGEVQSPAAARERKLLYPAGGHRQFERQVQADMRTRPARDIFRISSFLLSGLIFAARAGAACARGPPAAAPRHRALVQLQHRFRHGRARHRAAPRFQPIVHGTRRHARACGMIGE